MRHPFKDIGKSTSTVRSLEEAIENLKKVDRAEDFNLDDVSDYNEEEKRPMRIAPIYIHTEEKTPGIPANAFNIGMAMDVGHCILPEPERLAGRQKLIESLNGLTQEDINAGMTKIAPIMPIIGNFGDSWRDQLTKDAQACGVLMIDSLSEHQKYPEALARALMKSEMDKQPDLSFPAGLFSSHWTDRARELQEAMFTIRALDAQSPKPKPSSKKAKKQSKAAMAKNTRWFHRHR